MEGISRALRVFLKQEIPPQYKLVYPADGETGLVTATVSQEVREC
jgi:phenylalanyl-tRNA synthetase beta chain